jgi:hypothetical protein
VLLVLALSCSGDKAATEASDEEALQILAEAIAKQQALKTVRQVLVQEAVQGGQTIRTTQTTDYVFPRYGYSIVDAQTGRFELVIDGPTAYIRQPGLPWRSVQEALGVSLEQLGFSENSFAASFDLMPAIGSALLNGETVFAGQPVRRIAATLDSKKYLDLLGSLFTRGSPLAEALRTARDFTGSVEYLVGKSDLRIYRAIVDVSFTLQGSKLRSSGDATFSRFDEPVRFPADSPVQPR